MLVRGLVRGIRSILAAVFAPGRFVQVERTAVSTSLVAAIPEVAWVLTVWALNVVAYAVTLNLAGIGLITQRESPPWFSSLVGSAVGSPDVVWQWLVGTGQNSVFLIVATALVFAVFHTCVALADWSRRERYLQSLFTIAYTTSVYLAMMFTVVTWMSTTSRVQAAPRFIIGVQAEFIGISLSLIGMRERNIYAGAGTLDLTGVTPIGELVIVVLAVLALYFVYSLYLGARLNHGLNRRESSFVVAGILVAPVLFMWGSAAFTLVLEMYELEGVALVLQFVR